MGAGCADVAGADKRYLLSLCHGLFRCFIVNVSA
jgi:hypothetical protein